MPRSSPARPSTAMGTLHSPGPAVGTVDCGPRTPCPVTFRFKLDSTSSFDFQTRLPAPESLTLTSHKTHESSSVDSSLSPGHAHHTYSPTRAAWVGCWFFPRGDLRAQSYTGGRRPQPGLWA